jgi:hypothetical protein
VTALTRRLQAPLVRIVGDDAVRDVTVLPPGVPALDAAGVAQGVRAGGGTDFTPLLQEAARHRPDLVIVLTDLDGPARFRPACPVLWAVTEPHATAQLPFGQRLVLR